MTVTNPLVAGHRGRNDSNERFIEKRLSISFQLVCPMNETCRKEA